MSQPSPQKSLSTLSTVAARMLLVPRPLPAGMAESRVSSMPLPKSSSCERRVVGCERPKPASVSAAFGMEKGDPTRL